MGRHITLAEQDATPLPFDLPIATPALGPRPRRRPTAPPLTELVVDPVEHAGDIARFRAKMAHPPRLPDGSANPMCWIWTGAITDSYGQFSIVRGGFAYSIKAHKFAAAWLLGIPVPRGERADRSGGIRRVVEHAVCDNPICVKANPDPKVGHIWPSTQRENLARGGQRKRVGGSNWFIRRWSKLSKHERDERSRQLRAAVIDGWDEARVREVLLRIDPAQLDAFVPLH
ncbi:hypothetical protein [Amycolatopsis saalfeldensis]|uniref:Uncharacterized protein n=1 Tax=Amycolatopsis saalfeldensis TaxID=394193 RepID=A0A1H8YPI8_9PSEU|nr:hypothetical protein [Amycolatopsis saalfeldensis]SEP53952.1 hypothetical protein SAMN04489732_1347 [Amycolatopsis saalfeldensis]